jgi:hypothetical protein
VTDRGRGVTGNRHVGRCGLSKAEEAESGERQCGAAAKYELKVHVPVPVLIGTRMTRMLLSGAKLRSQIKDLVYSNPEKIFIKQAENLNQVFGEFD